MRISIFIFSVISLICGANGIRGIQRVTKTKTHVSTVRKSSGSICMMAEKQPLNVIIAGAPAAGKGTQCEMIKSDFGLVHLSTGDILRAAVKEGTELGLKAKSFMDAGKLVPDELITGVVCNRLKQPDCMSNGWLLDGFPRTKSQALALEAEGMVADSFILLDVPEEVLVERVSGRRTDPVTGKIYHMKFNPPENKEIEDRLIQRSDDTAEKIVVRYRDFQSNIDAVRSCFEPIISTIDGTQSQKDVSACVKAALDTAKARKLAAGKKIIDVNKGDSETVKLLLKAIVGVAVFSGVNELFKTLFQKLSISLPSSLGGMVAIFGGLTGLSVVDPKKSEMISDYLTPAVNLIKTWLALFFIPPLVVLPLKMHLLKNSGIKLVSLIVVGLFLSLSSTAVVAEFFKSASPSSSSSSSSKFSPSSVLASNVADKPKSTANAFSLPSPKVPLSLTAMLLVAIKFSPTPLVNTLFGIFATVSSFLVGVRTPAGFKKVVHPVISAAGLTVGFYSLLALMTASPTGPLLIKYLQGPGGLISAMLGPAIVSFGLQLYQYRSLLSANLGRVVFSTLFAAFFGLSSSAGMCGTLNILPFEAAMSPLTRCITTPLALAGGKLTGADPSLTAFVVVLTGMLGATFGERYLKSLDITDPMSVGLSVGASAHGIGTASLTSDPIKFSSAVVSMTLTGLWTVLLLSFTPFRELLVKMAFKSLPVIVV